MADEQSFRTLMEQQQQQDPTASGRSMPFSDGQDARSIPGLGNQPTIPMYPPTDFAARTPLNDPKIQALMRSIQQNNPNAAAGAPTLGPQPGLESGMPTQMQASPPQNLPGGGQSLPGYAVPGPSMPPMPPPPGITPPVTGKQMYGPAGGRPWVPDNGSAISGLVGTIQHISQAHKQKQSDEKAQQAAALFTADAIKADADKTGRPFTREEQGNIDRANAIKPALAMKLREEVTDMTSPAYRGLVQVQEQEKQRQAQIAAQQAAHAKIVKELSEAFHARGTGTANYASADLMHSGAKQLDLQADAAKKQAEAIAIPKRVDIQEQRAQTEAAAKHNKIVEDYAKDFRVPVFDPKTDKVTGFKYMSPSEVAKDPKWAEKKREFDTRLKKQSERWDRESKIKERRNELIAQKQAQTTGSDPASIENMARTSSDPTTHTPIAVWPKEVRGKVLDAMTAHGWKPATPLSQTELRTWDQSSNVIRNVDKAISILDAHPELFGPAGAFGNKFKILFGSGKSSTAQEFYMATHLADLAALAPHGTRSAEVVRDLQKLDSDIYLHPETIKAGLKELRESSLQLMTMGGRVSLDIVNNALKGGSMSQGPNTQQQPKPDGPNSDWKNKADAINNGTWKR